MVYFRLPRSVSGRMIQKHVITILILHWDDGFLASASHRFMIFTIMGTKADWSTTRRHSISEQSNILENVVTCEIQFNILKCSAIKFFYFECIKNFYYVWIIRWHMFDQSYYFTFILIIGIIFLKTRQLNIN